MKATKWFVLTNAVNCDYIILIKCISVNGYALSLFLIVAGKHFLDKWALKNDIEDDTVFTANESEYSNDELAIEWIKHFNKYTEHYCLNVWRIFIMNDYSSYMTHEFLNYITEYKICLFMFSVHLTHITQFLNTGVFQLYKYWYAENVN